MNWEPLANRALELVLVASPALLVRHWQMQASDNAMVSNAHHLTVISSDRIGTSAIRPLLDETRTSEEAVIRKLGVVSRFTYA